MKFTNGYWLMREGVNPRYPSGLHDTESQPGLLRLYSPFRKVEGRGDMLDTGMLTVELSSPMANIIKVRVVHHAGGQDRGPHFALASDPAFSPRVSDDGKEATLESGALKAKVAYGESWHLDFSAEGRSLTSSGFRGLAYIEAPEGQFVREELSLRVGESVYGLGERFSPYVKNGQSVEMWNADGGTGSEQTYKNIPFYLTNKGYGVLVASSDRVGFEVASEKNSRVQFSVPGQELVYYLIYGPEPKAILERYTALTGRPPLLPQWTFGLWLTTSFTTSYDEKTVTGIIDEMAERQLPLHVFHFDCFWMHEYQWTDFRWDKRIFPDPEGMLGRLKDKGIRICLWINPYIAQRSALFAEGKAKGYLIKRPNGDVWQWDLWQPGMGIVDFTNPEAREWFASHLRQLAKMGVDCFKTDFGERIPTEVVYHDGSDPQRMHNYFTYLYNKTVYEALKEVRGSEAILFARSATVGGQCFPVHWGGDSESSFKSMAESLRGGLSLALSGFGYWSHDIGGFEGKPRAEIYKRWMAFGLLSSHSRLHGSTSYRVPWLFDEEAVEVCRRFTKLKCTLMPYLYAAAVETAARGLPMMRPMIVEFPEDPASATLDRQYMLGPNLLVAPVFGGADAEVDYYLPAGRWRNFLTGTLVDAGSHGSWQREIWDFLGLPLMVRPGSVIPVGSVDDRPDYDYANKVQLRIFDLADGQAVTTVIPGPDGKESASFRTSRSGLSLKVQRSGSAKAFSAELQGIFEVQRTNGGKSERTARGLALYASADEASVEFILKA